MAWISLNQKSSYYTKLKKEIQMIKTIINPFISNELKHAVFIVDSKEEVINAIQELHELNCENCHIFDFGYIDDKKKFVLSDEGGLSLWWSIDSSPNEMEDEDINEYTNLNTDEEYNIPEAKRMYVNPSFELRKFGDEYLFTIQLFDYNEKGTSNDIDHESVYFAYKMIFEKAVLSNYKKDNPKQATVVPFKNKKTPSNKDGSGNVH